MLGLVGRVAALRLAGSRRWALGEKQAGQGGRPSSEGSGGLGGGRGVPSSLSRTPQRLFFLGTTFDTALSAHICGIIPAYKIPQPQNFLSTTKLLDTTKTVCHLPLDNPAGKNYSDPRCASPGTQDRPFRLAVAGPVASEAKMIQRRKGKFVVTDSTGSKVLGTHESKSDALAQVRAIEASKHRAMK